MKVTIVISIIVIVVSVLMLVYSFYIRRKCNVDDINRKIEQCPKNGNADILLALILAGQATKDTSKSKLLFRVGLVGLIAGIVLIIVGLSG